MLHDFEEIIFFWPWLAKNGDAEGPVSGVDQPATRFARWERRYAQADPTGL